MPAAWDAVGADLCLKEGMEISLPTSNINNHNWPIEPGLLKAV